VRRRNASSATLSTDADRLLSFIQIVGEHTCIYRVRFAQGSQNGAFGPDIRLTNGEPDYQTWSLFDLRSPGSNLKGILNLIEIVPPPHKNCDVACWPKCEVIECLLLRSFQGITGPDAETLESTLMTLAV
jgi:hypothetical protein